MTEFAPHHIEPKRLVGVVVRDIVISSNRGGSRGGVGDASPPPAIFKHAFDEYNFSIISNLFDNSKPYALSAKARIIENVQTKCIIFGETLRFRGKKFKQNLPKNCLKSTKIASTVSKFLKIFWGSMPLDPLKAFYILNLLQNNSAWKQYA